MKRSDDDRGSLRFSRLRMRLPFRSSVLAGSVLSGITSCGGSTTLDLGHSAPPWYATPETIAAEESAPPGVPTVIAMHQQGALSVAIDDARVYWRNADGNNLPPDRPPAGSVRSCVKSNCAATVIDYTRSKPVSGYIMGPLLVNRSRVFWFSASPSRLFSCPIEGCPAEGPRLDGVDGPPFAVDDDYLYWESDDATIWRCSVDDCNQRSLIVLRDSRPMRAVGGTAIDATHVYWFDIEGTSKVIKAAPKDGSGVLHTIVTRVVSPNNHLAVDATRIYWMESLPEAMVVKSCPSSGCSGEPVVVAFEAHPRSSPEFELLSAAITVDEKEVLWSTYAVGRGRPTPEGLDVIRACPKGGCGEHPTTVVQHQSGLTTMAVDKTHVYWTGDPPSDERAHPRDRVVLRIRRQP